MSYWETELFTELCSTGEGKDLWKQTKSCFLDTEFLMTSKHSMEVLSESSNK